MRRRYVQLIETGRVFKSLTECDKFLGSEGLTATILALEDNYHERFQIHLKEITKEEYDSCKNNLNEAFSDIVHTYQITCKWCGELFHPESIHQYYCNRQHYQVCSICGKQFNVTQLLFENKSIPSTCSKQCASLSRKQTIREKQKDPEYEKQKLEKRRKTCQEKYGVDNVSQSDIIKNKIVAVLEEKYGVDNPAKLPQAQKALKRYHEDQEKLTLATHKREETNLKLFGTKYFTQTIESRLENGFDLEHAQRLVKFYENPEQYIVDTFEPNPTAYEIKQHFLSSEPLQKLYGSSLIRWNISTIEQEVTDYLLKLNPDLVIKHNDRTQIKPLELDLFLPEYNIAIECNPTFTHNSSRNIFDYNPLSYDYHKVKTDLCEEHDIFLFHIFGYEWTYKKSQILNMLRNLINKNENKIYARKCDIRQVETIKGRNFLNLNHRQGYTSYKVGLGLYFEDKLVSLMTFSKMRSTIGTSTKNLADCWELVRFCSIPNTNVIGGASKLFAYFIKMYNPTQIKSFSDRAHTKGNLYKVLGFIFELWMPWNV